ncbi:unnamed protein product, partial [Mesorhabditis spiculigera]
MVRVIIKGGVWRNTEDEILKAAIMKYGKNQWSRIASLLHRKSAKQCKARWHEWLDPSIKKTEWSREEDEKLLHLAKLMPTQWRTIAPIVGRTATQCLERYEQLLDAAQRKAVGIDDEALEARKLKPGEIDPTPETKPARPDPIDMDDDELEMLSEARARLANTQGKKAKRKARERQLSEARRCASLQKTRELKAAGIFIPPSKFQLMKRPEVDYSAEIPFEKPVPAGFHDPSMDRFSNEDKTNLAVEDHRKKTGTELENEKRRADREKMKKRKAQEAEHGKVFEQQEKKRSKLILPTPQISEKELEEIVKIGHATEAMSQYADTAPTSGLLTDYVASARQNAANARTLRTPANHRDTLEKEVHNLLALQNVESSLKGGENTPLFESNFSTVTPIRQSMETPNTVLQSIAATPGTASFGRTPGQTPVGATPTPFRDQMGINQGAMDIYEQKADLRRALSSLPRPKNDFEIVAPDDEELKEEDGDEGEWVEDAEDRKEARAKARAEARLRELQQRTQVVQRDLPRPSKISEVAFRPVDNKSELNRAENLIKAEMELLVKWDIDGTAPELAFTPAQLADAKKLIDDEAEQGPPMDEEYWEAVDQCFGELAFSRGKFCRLGGLGKEQQIEALSQQFNMARDWMTSKAKKIGKIEKRVKIKLGGYTQVHAQLAQKIYDRQQDGELARIELNTFRQLAQHEEKAINKRVEKITKEVRQQDDRERELQKVHKELQHKRWLLEQMERRESASVNGEPVVYANGQ